MEGRIGVVVPCRNEEATIGRCLSALRAQAAVGRIVVVDNASTDASRTIAAALADQVVNLPGARISALRNHGASLLAAGRTEPLEAEPLEYVAFVDADCEVAPGWAAAALEALRDADLVGSRTFAPAGAGWVASRWAAIERRTAGPDALLWSQHLVLRRDLWERLGGFDETLVTGEDADLSLRVRRLGGRIALVEGMTTLHHGFPPSLRRFVRREVWHTSAPGWFPRMSGRSRLSVVATTGWLLLGTLATTRAATGRGEPLLLWSVASSAGVPALGLVAGRSPRHCAQDGVLVGLWNLVRAARLLQPRTVRGVAR
ncbi:glycosyltransferase [Nocardioides pacificus]